MRLSAAVDIVGELGPRPVGAGLRVWWVVEVVKVVAVVVVEVVVSVGARSGQVWPDSMELRR